MKRIIHAVLVAAMLGLPVLSKAEEVIPAKYLNVPAEQKVKLDALNKERLAKIDELVKARRTAYQKKEKAEAAEARKGAEAEIKKINDAYRAKADAIIQAK